MKTSDSVKPKNIQLRVPTTVYSKLQKVNKTKPHLSMNALIVEMLEDRLTALSNQSTGGTK